MPIEITIADIKRAHCADAQQRADRMRQQQAALFGYFGPAARETLNDLLEKYAIDGELQFTLPDVLKVAPIWRHGNVGEIVRKFNGVDELHNAVNQLQTLLYTSHPTDL